MCSNMKNVHYMNWRPFLVFFRKSDDLGDVSDDNLHILRCKCLEGKSVGFFLNKNRNFERKECHF